jgi:hypothetical protein
VFLADGEEATTFGGMPRDSSDKDEKLHTAPSSLGSSLGLHFEILVLADDSTFHLKPPNATFLHQVMIPPLVAKDDGEVRTLCASHSPEVAHFMVSRLFCTEAKGRCHYQVPALREIWWRWLWETARCLPRG